MKNDTLRNIAVGTAAAAVLYGIYKWTTRNNLTPEETEQHFGRVEANASTISYGTTTLKTAESSELNNRYAVLRQINDDGSLTTYRYIPSDLNAYQRYLIENNLYTIRNGVLEAKSFTNDSLLSTFFPSLKDIYDGARSLF